MRLIIPKWHRPEASDQSCALPVWQKISKNLHSSRNVPVCLLQSQSRLPPVSEKKQTPCCQELTDLAGNIFKIPTASTHCWSKMPRVQLIGNNSHLRMRGNFTTETLSISHKPDSPPLQHGPSWTFTSVLITQPGSHQPPGGWLAATQHRNPSHERDFSLWWGQHQKQEASQPTRWNPSQQKPGVSLGEVYILEVVIMKE